MSNNIGKRIKKVREGLELSQRDLANIIGSDNKHVSTWECGKKIPSVENLIKLCQVLDVSADYLLGID